MPCFKTHLDGEEHDVNPGFVVSRAQREEVVAVEALLVLTEADEVQLAVLLVLRFCSEQTETRDVSVVCVTHLLLRELYNHIILYTCTCIWMWLYAVKSLWP